MIKNPNLLFKKVHRDAKKPVKGYSTDAAYDLFAVKNQEILPNVPTIIATGLRVKLPKNYYAEIHTRSSWGMRGIRCHLGIIDENYTGDLSPIVISPERVEVKKGERVAQLIIKKRLNVNLIEVKELPITDRGNKGFGSTGK